MKYSKALLELALKSGLDYNGVDSEDEMQFTGTDKQWKEFEYALDNEKEQANEDCLGKMD